MVSVNVFDFMLFAFTGCHEAIVLLDNNRNRWCYVEKHQSYPHNYSRFTVKNGTAELLTLIGCFVFKWGWKQCLDVHRTCAFWYRTVSPDFMCRCPIHRDSLTPQKWICENVRRNALKTSTCSGPFRKALAEAAIVYGSLIGWIHKLSPL